MKRIIILGCIAATLTFSSCDDYLDIVPKGEAVLNKTSDYLVYSNDWMMKHSLSVTGQEYLYWFFMCAYYF